MARPLNILIGDIARSSGPGAVDPVALLRAKFGDGVRVLDTGDPGLDRLAAYAEADILITRRFGTSEPPAFRLRLLQVPATGYDGIDPAKLPSGCALCNVYGHEVGVGEYVLAALLRLMLRLDEPSTSFRAGQWRHGPTVGGPLRPELSGRTLGILGYGHIGRAVAKLARAFGMRVTALSRAPDRLSDVDRAWPWTDINDFLAGLDVLLISCPLNDETKGLIDAPRLARMRAHSLIVNVARAEITDERALFAALQEKQIGGAVLDVWWRYPSTEDAHPPPSSLPFRDLPNVIATPHVAVWSEGLLQRRWSAVIENVERLLSGEPLLNIVSPP